MREFRVGESEEEVLVFRSTRCRTVFQNVAENFICGDCSGRRGRKKIRETEEKRREPEKDLEAVDDTEEISIDVDVDEGEEDNFPRVCSYDGCNRSFRRLKPFHNHIKLHRMKEISQKQKDQKRRRKPKKLLKKKSSDGTYECEFCKTTYVYRKSFLKHVSSHQDPPPENQCEHCAEIFDSSEELGAHIEEKHRPRKRRERRKAEYAEIKCDRCNISFETLNQLSSHNIETHDRVGDPCHICGKYVKKSSMRNHVMMVHHADQIRKCLET